MRRLLLTSTFLTVLALAPSPAEAGIGVVAALVSNGVTWGAALTAVYGAVGAALIRIGASLLFQAAAQALQGKPKQAQVIRELLQPDSLPPYRFVYGSAWAAGSPAPVRVVGRILYACFILNSRPSAGPFTLYLDKRKMDASGDPYDFTGAGAAATAAPFAGYCRYWIGRGDQTSPPATILAEAPQYFESSDGWRGLTVIWLRLDLGANESRTERWPATPPEVMVDGKWSMVWDPRDPGQDPDDPATWVWSANQALCTLDALRQNPLRRYTDRNLWVETFADAADAADEPVAVKGGGTIPRYEVNGTLVFSTGAEIEDQVQPLASAGASRFTRVGGRLALVPGIWREPVAELTDVLGDQPMAFVRFRPSADLVTAVTANYTSPARAYEDAATPTFALAGAQEEDGGEEKLGPYDLRFITDHRQAQRVAKILGMRTRMQRSVSAVFPPRAFDLVAGSVGTLDLPEPYAARNGIYEVEEARPAFDPLGLEGVAVRVPLVLRETSPAVYAWDAETEEQEVVEEDFDASIQPVAPPGAVTATSGADTVLISGDSSIARVRFDFDPSTSASVTAYKWQYRRANSGGGPTTWQVWTSGGMIDADIVDGDGDVFGWLVPVQLGHNYQVRVRALSAFGRASEWATSNSVTASAGSYLAPAPTGVSAVGGAGEIAVTFRAPNDSDYRAMDIWVSAIDDAGSAGHLAGPIYGAANSTVTEIEDGLGSGVTRYYFARSIDRNGNISPFSASVSATTT